MSSVVLYVDGKTSKRSHPWPLLNFPLIIRAGGVAYNKGTNALSTPCVGIQDCVYLNIQIINTNQLQLVLVVVVVVVLTPYSVRKDSNRPLVICGSCCGCASLPVGVVSFRRLCLDRLSDHKIQNQSQIRIAKADFPILGSEGLNCQPESCNAITHIHNNHNNKPLNNYTSWQK